MGKDDAFKKVEDDYENVDPKSGQNVKVNVGVNVDVKVEDKSTRYFIITVAIIVLIIAAILGVRYIIKPKEKLETVTYNNFMFVKKGPLWYTQWKNNEGQLYDVPLHFNPYQAENVSITGKLSDKFDYDKIYITHDPAEYGLEYVSIAAGELSLSLSNALDMGLTAACSKNETEACSDRPIKNCNSNNSVIYLKNEGQTGITLNNTCITIQGEKDELVRAVDKLLYIWYGILKPQ